MAMLLEHNRTKPADTSSITGTGNFNMIFTIPPGVDPPKDFSEVKKPGCLCECHTPGTITKILAWPYPMAMKCAECTCRGL